MNSLVISFNQIIMSTTELCGADIVALDALMDSPTTSCTRPDAWFCCLSQK
jgi:hypothetical protein